MYKRIILIAIILSLIIVLGGCEKSESTGPATTQSSIVFLDYGAVIANATSTLVTVEPGDIKFVSKQKGSIQNAWSAKIKSAEYHHLISIIENNKLIGAQDPNGGQPCIGSRGMSIYIRKDNIVDTINISGLYMCDKSCWPIGLDSLVAFQDSLVNKYKQ